MPQILSLITQAKLHLASPFLTAAIPRTSPVIVDIPATLPPSHTQPLGGTSSSSLLIRESHEPNNLTAVVRTNDELYLAAGWLSFDLHSTTNGESAGQSSSCLFDLSHASAISDVADSVACTSVTLSSSPLQPRLAALSIHNTDAASSFGAASNGQYRVMSAVESREKVRDIQSRFATESPFKVALSHASNMATLSQQVTPAKPAVANMADSSSSQFDAQLVTNYNSPQTNNELSYSLVSPAPPSLQQCLSPPTSSILNDASKCIFILL